MAAARAGPLATPLATAGGSDGGGRRRQQHCQSSGACQQVCLFLLLQVLLHIPDPRSRPYVYATSWWSEETVDRYLRWGRALGGELM